MKIKQTVFIHYQKYPWQEKGGFVVLSLPLNNDATHTMICQQEIELDIPDEFSPYEQHIATLIEEKEKANAKHLEAIAKIDDEIATLKGGVENV